MEFAKIRWETNRWRRDCLIDIGEHLYKSAICLLFISAGQSRYFPLFSKVGYVHSSGMSCSMCTALPPLPSCILSFHTPSTCLFYCRPWTKGKTEWVRGGRNKKRNASPTCEWTAAGRAEVKKKTDPHPFLSLPPSRHTIRK